MTASAAISSVPSTRLSGAFTTKEAAVFSPSAASDNGTSAGSAVQPCGSRSLTVPFTAFSVRFVVRTTTRCVFGVDPVGTIISRESTPTVTAGTTLTSRRSSPRTRSPVRYCTGRVICTAAPPICADTSTLSSGASNGVVRSPLAGH
jgi:hypothetical protein